jgi:hypothetical protein
MKATDDDCDIFSAKRLAMSRAEELIGLHSD